jgi:hypothetical protein
MPQKAALDISRLDMISSRRIGQAILPDMFTWPKRIGLVTKFGIYEQNVQNHVIIYRNYSANKVRNPFFCRLCQQFDLSDNDSLPIMWLVSGKNGFLSYRLSSYKGS